MVTSSISTAPVRIAPMDIDIGAQRLHAAVHVLEVAGHGHLVHRIRQLAVLHPEA